MGRTKQIKLTPEEQTARNEMLATQRRDKKVEQYKQFGTESKGAGLVIKEAINKAAVALVGDVRIQSSSLGDSDFTVEVRQAFAINATVYIRLKVEFCSSPDVRLEDGTTYSPMKLIVEVNTPGTGRDVEASIAFAQLLVDLNTFALRVKAMLMDRTFYHKYTPEAK